MQKRKEAEDDGGVRNPHRVKNHSTAAVNATPTGRSQATTTEKKMQNTQSQDWR